jgi:hypothetical protein
VFDRGRYMYLVNLVKNLVGYTIILVVIPSRLRVRLYLHLQNKIRRSKAIHSLPTNHGYPVFSQGFNWPLI